MKSHPTPIAYPTTKEEEIKWGFDVLKPKGTPKAWILDWSANAPGFDRPRERLTELSKFELDVDITKFTPGDISLAQSTWYKGLYFGMAELMAQKYGEKATKEFLGSYSATQGKRIWQIFQQKFGSPLPLDKISWFQDVGHTSTGPDNDAPAWYDEEKSVVCRTRCYMRAMPGQEHLNKWGCGTLCEMHTANYMEVEPGLYCARILRWDTADDENRDRCIHVWTYKKEVFAALPDNLKANISEPEAGQLRKKGVKI